MSLVSNFEAIWQKDEAWVVGFFANAKKSAAVVEADMLLAISWLSAHSGSIATALTGLVTVAAAAGLGLPVPVSGALTAMNQAVALVNQAAAAAQGAKVTGSDTAALVAATVAGAQAYQALKASQVATAQAQAHVANGQS